MIESKEIIKRAKIALNATSDTQLADILGVKKSTLSNWKARNSIDFNALFSKCGQIDYNWLITGEGEMLRTASTEVAPLHTFSLQSDRKLESQDIPLYDLSATAGLMAIFNDNHISPDDYLRIPNLHSVDGSFYV